MTSQKKSSNYNEADIQALEQSVRREIGDKVYSRKFTNGALYLKKDIVQGIVSSFSIPAYDALREQVLKKNKIPSQFYEEQLSDLPQVYFRDQSNYDHLESCAYELLHPYILEILNAAIRLSEEKVKKVEEHAGSGSLVLHNFKALIKGAIVSSTSEVVIEMMKGTLLEGLFYKKVNYTGTKEERLKQRQRLDREVYKINRKLIRESAQVMAELVAKQLSANVKENEPAEIALKELSHQYYAKALEQVISSVSLQTSNSYDSALNVWFDHFFNNAAEQLSQ